MSHQHAKQIARQIVADLISKHPPGLVAMILDQLKIIRRATKDLTIYQPQPPAAVQPQGEAQQQAKN